MYKVCFVDDEILDFEMLEKLVGWKAGGFEIAGTATDGLEALELFEAVKPDLIFIDIQMPVMDGLECIRRIRGKDKQVFIVIISAYEEFEYAQKAISYGVNDYLIKPVGRVALNEIVRKIKVQLDERNQAQADDYQNQMKMFWLEIQKKLLQEGGITPGMDDRYRYFFQTVKGVFCIRCYLPDGSHPKQEQLERVRERIDERMRERDGGLVSFVEAEGTLIFLSTLEKWETDWPEEAARSVPEIRADILSSDPDAGKQGVSDFILALNRFENPAFYDAVPGEGGVFVFQEKFASGGEQDGEDEQAWNDKTARRIVDLLVRNAGQEEILSFFDGLIDRASEELLDPGLLKNRIIDLLVEIKLSLKSLCREDSLYLLRSIDMNELQRIEKASLLKRRLQEIMQELYLAWQKVVRTGSRESRVVDAANFYAREHYAEEGFSVKKAARYVGMSSNYFVSMYKELAGQGFWDYVTQIRIRKAMELLSATEETVGSIARKIGYANEYHFSRKFKEITGSTPTQYRKDGQRPV